MEVLRLEPLERVRMPLNGRAHRDFADSEGFSSMLHTDICSNTNLSMPQPSSSLT